MSQPERRAEAMRELGVRINAFPRDAAATVRERFQGGVTYASIQFEQVDWTPFDMVTYELIRSAEVVDRFRLSELLDVFEAEGVDSAFVFLFALPGYPHRPDGDPRDDLDRAGLGIVKILEGRRGRTYPDMEWAPKAAFAAVAQRYRR